MKSTETIEVARAVAPLAALLEPTEVNDVVILSFTANLGFFSKAAAGRARSRGARVSIVSDLAQTTFDPDAVRGAGWDWLDGRAWCTGAFHPKLIVAAGEADAAVLVGSGNATPAGWVDNAEVWIRMNATSEGCPQAVHDIAAWLTRLPDHVHVSPGVAESLISAAKRLTRFAPTGDGPRFVHNLDEPIWATLPAGPVDELVVSSPFLDASCAALRRVCEQLQPASLTVAVADDFHFDGAELAGVLADWHGSAVTIASDRYHHGKVIEWSSGLRQALIGSPNCTTTALGRTVGDTDGNCEIALICDVDTTLAPPAGAMITTTGLVSHRYAPLTSPPAPLLYAAVVEEPGVRLFLRRPSDFELRVEVYDGATWRDTGYRVRSEVDQFLCVDWRPDRSVAIRVTAQGGTGTTPVAATVLARLDPRPASRTDLGGSSGEFIDNPQFIATLQAALARIRASLVASRGTHAGAAPAVRVENRDTPRPTWQQVVERVRVETGERFSWFSLPHLSRRAGLLPSDVRLDDDAIESDSEADEDGGLTDVERDRIERLKEYRRRRIADLRRWCTRYYDPDALTDSERAARRRAAADAGFDPATGCSEIDIATAAVVLAAHQLGAWDDVDDEAITLTRALRPLGRALTDDSLAPDAAAVAAVGLWIHDRLVERSGERAGARTTYRGLAHHLASLLDRLDERALAARCATLATVTHPAPPPDDVFTLALGVAVPDLDAEFLSRLDEEAGVIAEMTARVVDVVGELAGDGLPTLLRWLTWGEHLNPVALRARTRAAGVVTVAWRAPDLVIAVEKPRPRGVVYRLPRGPIVALNPDNGRIDTRHEQASWFGDAPPPAATDVLEACGVDELG